MLTGPISRESFRLIMDAEADVQSAVPGRISTKSRLVLCRTRWPVQ